MSGATPDPISSPGFPGEGDPAQQGGGALRRETSHPSPYEGRHLIAELHGCSGLADLPLIERALAAAAAAAGATLLELRLHGFGAGQGITGVALLAESHISIHTWPEHGYAAVDIFLCAPRHDLEAALGVLAKALQADRVEQQLIARGYSAQASVTV